MVLWEDPLRTFIFYALARFVRLRLRKKKKLTISSALVIGDNFPSVFIEVWVKNSSANVVHHPKYRMIGCVS
jgi:hypothetical protein